MASLNKVQIIGNLGSDPAIKQVGTNSVANFSVATKEAFTKDGQKTERTEWHKIVAWGKTAENIGKYLKKGSSIFLEGKLQTRKYSKDGIDHYTTEIVAMSVQFLSSKSDGKTSDAPKSGPFEESYDYDLSQIPF